MWSWFRLFPVLALCIIAIDSGYAQGPKWEWIKNIGSQSTGEDVQGVQVDTKGNLIVVSNLLDSSFTIGKTLSILKYTPEGNLIWRKRMASHSLDQTVTIFSSGLCVDSNDNIYFKLGYNDSIFFFESQLIHGMRGYVPRTLLKLTPEGDLQWTKTFPEANNIGYGEKTIAIDHANNVVVVGDAFIKGDSVFRIDGTAYFTSRDVNFYMAVLTPQGNAIWAKQINRCATSQFIPKAIGIDNENNAFVAGIFNGIFSNGEIDLPAEGTFDIFLQKFDPEGKSLWLDRIGGPTEIEDFAYQSDVAWDMALDGENAYVAGVVIDTVTIAHLESSIPGGRNPDILITKFDKNGIPKWNKRIGSLNWQRIGGTIGDFPISIAYSLPKKQLICSAQFYDTVTIESAMLSISNKEYGMAAVWSYSAEGNLNWVLPLTTKPGDVPYSFVYSITADRSGSLYLGGFAGIFLGLDATPVAVNLNDSVITTEGGTDGLLAKLSLPLSSRVLTDKSLIPLTFFPNPFRIQTNLQLPSEFVSDSKVFYLYNILGSKVQEKHIESGVQLITIDREDLTVGVYHYRIRSDSGHLLKGELIVN